MIYAQFFSLSTGYVEGTIPPRFDGPKKLIEATGDRAVIVIDGRLLRSVQVEIARKECAKRGYLAWQLHSGEAFTRSVPISEVHSVENTSGW